MLTKEYVSFVNLFQNRRIKISRVDKCYEFVMPIIAWTLHIWGKIVGT